MGASAKLPANACHLRQLQPDTSHCPVKAWMVFGLALLRHDGHQVGRASSVTSAPAAPAHGAAGQTMSGYSALSARRWGSKLLRRHGILIVQDAAYATLAYGRAPLSLLGRPGARDCAVELHSMSKSYNMTGWRLGFVAGAAPAVRAFAAVKDNVDSGQFKAIQAAACAGIADLRLSQEIREHYRVRLEKMTAVLRRAGFDAEMPGGTFYLYTPAPRGARGASFATAEDASQYLIREQSISTVPWDDAGAYLRFSATFESADDADDDRVLAELDARLAAAELRFA